MKNVVKKQITKLCVLSFVLLMSSCTIGDPLYADNRFNGALISVLLVIVLCLGGIKFYRRRKVTKPAVKPKKTGL